MTNLAAGQYLCFEKDTPLAEAVQIFKERYHHAPDEHFTEYRMLWLGPIKKKEKPLSQPTPQGHLHGS